MVVSKIQKSYSEFKIYKKEALAEVYLLTLYNAGRTKVCKYSETLCPHSH